MSEFRQLKNFDVFLRPGYNSVYIKTVDPKEKNPKKSITAAVMFGFGVVLPLNAKVIKIGHTSFNTLKKIGYSMTWG